MNRQASSVKFQPGIREPHGVCGVSVIDDSRDRTHPHVADDPAALFPLPLAAFAQYMLLDDGEEYPVTFYLQFRLVGRLGVTPLAEATKGAGRGHALPCVPVKRVRGSSY